MVQVLEENRNPKFSERLMHGLSKASSEAASELPRFFGERMLKEKENNKLKSLGIDIKDIQDPHTRSQIIAEELRRGTLNRQGEAGLPPEFRGPGQPTVNDQSGKGTPIPPEKSSADKYLNPEQLKREAAKTYWQKRQAGGIADFQEELQLARQKNADIFQHQQVQALAGQKSDEALSKVLPEATDEHKAILRAKAEGYAEQGLSQSDIDRKIAQDATKFKNQLASIQRSLPPKRLLSRVKEKVLGTGREEEKQINSIRFKLKPLLDQGLYDTARNALSEVGYGPEEREQIISSLGEEAKKGLAAFPVVKEPYLGAKRAILGDIYGGDAGPLKPKDQEKFEKNISDILKADPSTNLILLRKAYEDKKVDWRTYKDQLDKLMMDGEFEPNEDQTKALDLLDEPPLDRLDKILHTFNLIGR